MPERHLKQPGFTYSSCGSFTKDCKRIENCRETSNLKNSYKNSLDKTFFFMMLPILIVKI